MMPMDKPTDAPKDDKDSYFSCPACGAKLCAETKDADMAEDKPAPSPMDAPKKDPMDRADKMPMDRLKNVLMSAKPKPEPQGY